MAHNPQITSAAASAAADAVVDLLDVGGAGYLRIYDSTGTGQPATADDAVTTQVLLAELRFGPTAFGDAANGVATANAITADAAANAAGTATWFRALAGNGSTAVFDGTVGASGSGSDLEINTASIVAGAEVSVTALTYTQSKT